jgi:hypothetical protein
MEVQDDYKQEAWNIFPLYFAEKNFLHSHITVWNAWLYKFITLPSLITKAKRAPYFLGGTHIRILNMVHILSRYKHSSYLHQESHTNHLRLLIYRIHFSSLYVKFYPEATTLAVNIVKTRFPNLNPWGWEIHQ